MSANQGSGMEYAEACRLLSGRGWLAGLPAPLRDAILARSSLQSIENGRRVCKIGDTPNGLWGVVTGGFAVEFATTEHGPHLAHSLRPGMWFGECEAFAGRPRFITIAATRPSHCLHLPSAALETVAGNHPLLWRHLGILAGAHVADALGAFSDSILRDTKARIAAILLRLAGVGAHERLEDAEPELDLTQEDLALLANVSRATVHGVLMNLESTGLVARSYGRIRILDAGALRATIR